MFVASIAHNDLGLVNILGIPEELERILAQQMLNNGLFPALYGDNIYQMCTTGYSIEDCVRKNGY